jgi:drug/metabolite transporter (DMT)-like permease
MISVWMLFAFGAMFGWGLGQGFTKKFINDVSGTKFCLYFVVAVSIVNLSIWAFYGAPNPFLTDAGEFESGFVFFGISAYILDGIAWAAYFICIKYAPITIVGTVAAAYPAIVMAVLFVWIGQDASPIMWGGGVLVILGCILLGYTPKSAVDETIDNSHVVKKIWIPLAVIAALGWGFAFSFLGYTFSPVANFEGAGGADIYPLMAIGDALIMLPFAVIAGRKTDTHNLSGIKLAAIPMVFFAIGNACMPMANAFDTDGLHGGLISAISAAYPMVTLWFAYIFLKERVIAFHWLSIAIVIFGIVLCTGAFEILAALIL